MTVMTATGTQLEFVEPLPGFIGAKYTLDPIDSQGLLFSLRSVDQPEVRFVLATALTFFPGYRPELSAALAAPLGADEIDLFVVLTVVTGLGDATANLRAPVAVARATGRAVQVILDDETLSMRAPLVSG